MTGDRKKNPLNNISFTIDVMKVDRGETLHRKEVVERNNSVYN